jgi:predicted metal-binding membrane protein
VTRAPGREATTLLAAAGLAAAALLAIGQTAWGPLVHHGPAAGGHGAHAGVAPACAAWLVGWGLMVAAMMLPGTVPLVRDVGDMARARAFTVVGFLGVWGAFGVAALAAVAVSRGMPAGLVLVAVGAYQLSPAKRRALGRCRGHARLLPPGWASGRDPTGDALRAGVAHARSSVACCGPLMAATAIAGMGAPLLMAAAALAMTLEVAASLGPRLTRPIGVALIAAGVIGLAL